MKRGELRKLERELGGLPGRNTHDGHLRRPGALTFSPNVVKRGTVVFKIRNRAGATYKCEVNLVSKLVRTNQVVQMTVVFKRPGVYNAGCSDPLNQEGTGIAGVLRVT
jgi:hypothetical protein